MTDVSEGSVYLYEDDWRVGVRLWGEANGYVELVYQEYKESNHEDKAVVLLSKEQLNKLYKAAMFLIDMESENER